MKIKFDSTLDYQRDAINAVVDLFVGQPIADSAFSVSLSEADVNTLALSELGIGNRLMLTDDAILSNVHSVQERNDILKIDALQGRHFSVEMETGTGKTYVYLRTMFEMNKRYGFTKFIIVVPSVPIREGILKSIEMLQEHLFAMYTTRFESRVYDSKRVQSIVGSFARAASMQLLVMTLDAFNKDTNILNQERERGREIDRLAATQPIVVLDEPQNMETDKASQAIERLNPLCTLRYSATHKNPYNLVYRLDPIQAYDLRLVKRVEVASVQAEESVNNAFVRLLEVDNRRGLRARVVINVADGAHVKQKKVWVKKDDDLWHISNERHEYRNGFIVADVNFAQGSEYIEFSNDLQVELNDESGGLTEDVMQAQVFETVKQHMEKERLVKGKGVKVLSLFFVDKVASYRIFNNNGTTSLGKVGQWFEEAFNELSAKPRYAGLISDPVENLHDGYFSMDRRKVAKDTSGKTADDEDAYALIMRDKERLLSFETPLRFIFSHSALREGWDNPNVFQICTLAAAKSSDRKRQEIGRGLRLPVNQAGERIHDESLNRLTVVANESYDAFARALQNEFAAEGYDFGTVSPEAFAKIIFSAPGEPIQTAGQEKSKKLYDDLLLNGYIDSKGRLTSKFAINDPNFELEVPDDWEGAEGEVTDILKKYDMRSRVKDARKTHRLTYQKKVELDPTFQELWRRISQRTRYRVSFSSSDLVGEAVSRIKKAPAIRAVRVNIDRVEIEVEQGGVRAENIVGTDSRSTTRPKNLPDILGTLQNETQLTRRSLVRILTESGRLDDFTVNPQAFVSMATECINAAMHSVMLAGVEYERIANSHWEMRRLESDAEKGITRYLDNLYEVQHKDKTLYDQIEFDSDVERRFAKALDDHEFVELFVKLPKWFHVDTPIGPYNPDWAIVTSGNRRLFFVRETKSTLENDKRRKEENDKIACGRKHFTAIDVDFAVTTDMRHMLDTLPEGGDA